MITVHLKKYRLLNLIEEAAQLVEEYNKVAKEKGFGKKTSRWFNSKNSRRSRSVRRVGGMRGLRSPRAKYGGLLGQMASRDGMRMLSRDTRMPQASLIQSALMQSGWRGSSIRGGASIRGQGRRSGIFDQSQMLQGILNDQMMQGILSGQMMLPQVNQFLGGNVNQMMGRGGYGMGMNARHF